MNIYGILFSLKQEQNPAICNMDEPGGHHAKWNKPDTERQLLRGITYMWNLKRNEKVKLIETESWMVAARDKGVGEIGRGW